MRVRPVGADALLLEVDEPLAWFLELRNRRDAGEITVVDIVPGAGSVLLDGLPDVAAATEAVRSWTLAPDQPSGEPGGEVVEIDVRFTGQDLFDVAQFWQTDVDGVIDRLTTIELHVAFCGFTPGWAYLAGLPAELAVPRLATPRPKVPAGSVALADTYAGIYPTASPGGWRLVGSTDVTLFDPQRDPPALLTPGTRVRLVRVDQ